MNMKKKSLRYKLQKSAQQGMAILEALIAVVIFSMGILALVGLQASMLRNTADSKYRSNANYIAQQAVGNLWADPTNIVLEDKVSISSVLPNGVRTITNPATNQYLVTVGWTAPGELASTDDAVGPCFMLVAHCFTTTATIAGATP